MCVPRGPLASSSVAADMRAEDIKGCREWVHSQEGRCRSSRLKGREDRDAGPCPMPSRSCSSAPGPAVRSGKAACSAFPRESCGCVCLPLAPHCLLPKPQCPPTVRAAVLAGLEAAGSPSSCRPGVQEECEVSPQYPEPVLQPVDSDQVPGLHTCPHAHLRLAHRGLPAWRHRH